MCLYLANILISVVLCMVKFVITHLHVSGIAMHKFAANLRFLAMCEL